MFKFKLEWYKHIHSIFILWLDVTCSSWPEGNGCAGEGRPGDHGHIRNYGAWRDWVLLAPWMDNSDSAHCEKLCKEYRENGCCYLSTGDGCYWRPGGYSVKTKGDIGISVDCHRSGGNKNTDFYDQQLRLYIIALHPGWCSNIFC